MIRHLALAVFALPAATPPTHAAEAKSATPAHPTMHQTIKVDGLDIFYREAGPADGVKPDAKPLPEHWLTGLRAYGEIQHLIETIQSHA